MFAHIRLQEQLPFHQFLLILCYSFLPYKCILVGIGFYLSSVNENIFPGNFAELKQKLCALGKKMFCTRGKMKAAESCNGGMIRYRFTFKEIHVIDIPVASSLDFSGRIFSIKVSIKNDLQHLAWGHLVSLNMLYVS